MLQVKTQQHKSISLRALVTNLQNGIAPQNVHHHKVFDFDKEPDFDSQVVDDFSDKLEVMESHRLIQESISNQIDNYQKEKTKKTKSTDEAKTPPPASEAGQEDAEDN